MEDLDFESDNEFRCSYSPNSADGLCGDFLNSDSDDDDDDDEEMNKKKLKKNVTK